MLNDIIGWHPVPESRVEIEEHFGIVSGVTCRSVAVFSPDLAHRYILSRNWSGHGKPYVVVMLNPSTADAFKNDPTVAACMRRAVRSGHTSLVVANVGAGRATDPADWKTHVRPHRAGE